MSLHDPIGTDKEGNEITLIDILGSGADDLLLTVDLNIEKSKNTGTLIFWTTGRRKLWLGGLG